MKSKKVDLSDSLQSIAKALMEPSPMQIDLPKMPEVSVPIPCGTLSSIVDLEELAAWCITMVSRLKRLSSEERQQKMDFYEEDLFCYENRKRNYLTNKVEFFKKKISIIALSAYKF